MSDSHQSSRVFLVCDLPIVRRWNSVRELQHFADVSQAARAPRMPLLRILAARAGDLSEVRLRNTFTSSVPERSSSRKNCARKFSGARIARLDRDAVRTKRAYQQVLGDFASGKIDILVGTQMVAKGHDFQRVTLVGVVPRIHS